MRHVMSRACSQRPHGESATRGPKKARNILALPRGESKRQPQKREPSSRSTAVRRMSLQGSHRERTDHVSKPSGHFSCQQQPLGGLEGVNAIIAGPAASWPSARGGTVPCLISPPARNAGDVRYAVVGPHLVSNPPGARVRPGADAPALARRRATSKRTLESSRYASARI